MELSINQITDKINKHINLFGLTLTVIVIAWTYYCVCKLWYGIKIDLCQPNNESPLSWKGEYSLCSTWIDLANSLTYILIGVSLFFIVLNPFTYHPIKSLLRSVILFPIFSTIAIITLLGTMEAGYINGVHFIWWFVMTLINMTLIVVGLILRWRRARNNNR